MLNKIEALPLSKTTLGKTTMDYTNPQAVDVGAALGGQESPSTHGIVMGPPKDQQELEARRLHWLEILTHPALTNALMSFGATLSRPGVPGQTVAGQLGEGFANAGIANQETMRGIAETQLAQQQMEAQRQNEDRKLGIGEEANRIAEETAGLKNQVGMSRIEATRARDQAKLERQQERDKAQIQHWGNQDSIAAERNQITAAGKGGNLDPKLIVDLATNLNKMFPDEGIIPEEIAPKDFQKYKMVERMVARDGSPTKTFPEYLQEAAQMAGGRRTEGQRAAAGEQQREVAQENMYTKAGVEGGPQMERTARTLNNTNRKKMDYALTQMAKAGFEFEKDRDTETNAETFRYSVAPSKVDGEDVITTPFKKGKIKGMIEYNPKTNKSYAVDENGKVIPDAVLKAAEGEEKKGGMFSGFFQK